MNERKKTQRNHTEIRETTDFISMEEGKIPRKQKIQTKNTDKRKSSMNMNGRMKTHRDHTLIKGNSRLDSMEGRRNTTKKDKHGETANSTPIKERKTQRTTDELPSTETTKL